MAQTTPRAKGDALEMAVIGIEHAILAEADDYVDKTFVIDSKKIVEVNGVHHEIDVWVQVLIADQYDPIFIFECKNWEDKVGKNEIIVFSEKIRAVAATKGFFVAKAFTADAESQALQDSRLKLLRAEEVKMTNPVEVQFRMICRQQPHEATFAIHPWVADGNNPQKLENPTVILNGRVLKTDEFFQPLAREATDHAFSQFHDDGKAIGVFDVSAVNTREFHEGDLIIDGKAIRSIQVTARCKVKVLRPRISSYFDVLRRGRFHRAEDIDVDGCKVAIGFITSSFREQANHLATTTTSQPVRLA
jgi:hypothetical protein